MPQGFSLLSYMLIYLLSVTRTSTLSRRKMVYEAMLESYLPCLNNGKYERDGINYSLTISLSPTLMFMMEDELLSNRFGTYLNNMQNLARREEERTTNDSVFPSGPDVQRTL